MRLILLVLLLGFGSITARAVVHGTVLFPAPLSLTSSLSNPVGVATGDFDGDGLLDVVASSNQPERIIWFRNTGNGTFAAAPFTVTTSPFTAALTNVAVADLNLDGRPDIIYWAGTSVRWTPNAGGSNPAEQFDYDDGAETANQFPIATTGDPETTVFTGDLNNDGRPDVLSATVTDVVPDNSVAWVPNLTTGFGARVVISTAGASPTSIHAVDLDKDGWRDLLVTSGGDHAVAWFRNLGAGNFGSAPGNRRVIVSGFSTGVFSARDAAAGDINGDGWPDVVAVGNAASNVRWFAHNGSAVSPVIGPASTVVTQGVTGAYSVGLHDMNSDGWLDVVIALAGNARVVWCENLGGGNFGDPATNQRIVGTGSLPIAMTVADIDANGIQDVVSNFVGAAAVRFFQNAGGQTAFATVDTAPGSIIEGRRDDLLRIAVSHRGVAGDSAVRLGTLALQMESSAGVPLDTAQANALLDKIAVHLDADSSGVFDPELDPAVATVGDLTLTGGLLSVPFAGSAPASIDIAPGATRSYFVVPKMAATATAVAPPTLRITHRSSGAGRTVLRDATTAAVLTSEIAGSANVASSVVTATAQGYTYTDWSFIHYDSAGTPGTGPLDTPAADGVANLLKFGLAIDPLAGGAPLPLPVMIRIGGAKVFRHRRPAQAVGVSHQYDIARTMGNWTPAVENVDYTKQETVLPGGQIQTDLTVLGPWGRSFLRVRVVLAP